MSPKSKAKDQQRSQQAKSKSKASGSQGVVASPSAMAGEESVRGVRGEAAKDEKKKQSRDEAPAKSRNDEGHEPSEVMFTPSDSGTKVRRPKSLPPQRSTMNPKQKAMQAKLKALEKEEAGKAEVFTFSPGPSQMVSTKMKKLIEEEIRHRVDEELKKFGGNPTKDATSSVSKAVSRKLFLSPDSEGEEEVDDKAAQFRKRMQRTFEADELKKQDEALKKKKKEWYEEQQRVKKIEEEIKRLEQERQRIPTVQLFNQEEEVPQDGLTSLMVYERRTRGK